MVLKNKTQLILGVLLLFLGAGLPLYGQEKLNADINWLEFDHAARLSVDNNKPILVFMEADWCGFCKKMHREVFPVSSISSQLNTYFYPVRIDIESNEVLTHKGEEMTHKSFSQLMKIQATPTTVFLKPDQTVIGSKSGYMDTDEFSILMKYIYTNKWQETSFDDYQSSLYKD